MIKANIPHDFNARTAIVAAQAGGAIDADCAECCTMRLPRYNIFVRSFHPNKIFEETDHVLGRFLGGPWSGDDRGFSLNPNDTSRVMHQYTADTAQMPRWFQTIRPIAKSDPSHALSLNKVVIYPPVRFERYIDLVESSPYGRLYETKANDPQRHPDVRLLPGSPVIIQNPYRPVLVQPSLPKLIARSIPEAKIVRSDLLIDQPCRKSATVVTHHFGVNLAVPPFVPNPPNTVPDLDVFAKISFDVDRAARTLDIETTVFGDKFPNCEAFLEDEAGTRVFLGVSTRVGYPINWLGQSTLSGVRTDFMFESRLKFMLNESGALLRFASGLSINSWNSRFIALNKNDTTIPTSFTQR